MINMSNIFLDDYDYVVDTIKSTHPLGFLGFDGGFESSCDQFRELVKDKNSLIIALSKLTSSLNDGHTNIEIPYGDEDLCLNIPCGWFENQLFVTSKYNNLNFGDVIISIDNMPISDYFNELCAYIPHENTYLVKCRSTKIPYQNYHLFSKLNLNNILHNDSSAYIIKIDRNGIMKEYRLELEIYNGCVDFLNTENFIDFNIVENFAVLRIDECKYNQAFQDKLDEFFKFVNHEKITHILLDLSENMGGNSMVTQEFIKHLDIDSYLFYGIGIRESNGDLSNLQANREVVTNEKSGHNLYNGKLSCIISNTTFSSARIFATVLKDNHLSYMIGENSGGKPTSFGAPTKYFTPNTKIGFRVSARIFYRPDKSKDDESSLTPDLFIPRRLSDVDYSTRIRNIIEQLTKFEPNTYSS